VNSGRLAEPFWYTQSPLTTGEADGESTPVDSPVVRPGLLCPDVQLADRSWLRNVFGTGFTLIANTNTNTNTGTNTGTNTNTACVATRAGQTGTQSSHGPTPMIVHTDAIQLADSQVAVIRPDGYIAAIVHPSKVDEALQRASGHFPKRNDNHS
jgi:3-(3-hydroxy-phenyl)propionate hydroxylase